MTPESPDDIDRRLKELDREKREEELRQLKANANAKAKWTTPTVLLSVLPFLGAFGVWAIDQVNKNSKAQQASHELDKLKEDWAKLQQERRDSEQQTQTRLLEVMTLDAQKQALREELKKLEDDIKSRQDQIDTAYLEIKWNSALFTSMAKTMNKPPSGDEVEASRDDVKRLLPKENADRMTKILDHFKSLPSDAEVKAFRGDVKQLSKESAESG